MNFHDDVKPSSQIEHPSLDKHDELLGERIKAMRTDRFGIKINEGYPNIHFTGRSRDD